MKFRDSKKAGAGSYCEFKFDVGVGSRIKKVIVDICGGGNTTDQFDIWCSPIESQGTPVLSNCDRFNRISQLFDTDGASVINPTVEWDLYHNEVFAEGESYFVAVATVGAIEVLVNLIYEKVKR